MSKTVLFPGSFDPFTKGHAALVKRALQLFDTVVVAIGYNEQKAGWLPISERVAAIEQLYKDEPRVKVLAYKGLTTDIAVKTGAVAILRGVRTMHDYEYEQQMATVNRQLTGIETILLFADPQLAHISSSIVRELAHFGQDISEYIPKNDE